MLKYLNEKCRKYKPLIGVLGIATILIGYFFWMVQIHQMSVQLRLMIDRKIGEETPEFKFDVINPEGVIKISPLTENVIFQYAEVTYSKEFRGKISNPPIRIYDHNWYLPGIKAYWLVDEKKKKELTKIYSYQYFSTPVGLKINFTQYGQVKNIKGIFIVSYVVQKDIGMSSFGIDRYNVKLLGVYRNCYVTSDNNLIEIIDGMEEEMRTKRKDHTRT